MGLFQVIVDLTYIGYNRSGFYLKPGEICSGSGYIASSLISEAFCATAFYREERLVLGPLQVPDMTS